MFEKITELNNKIYELAIKDINRHPDEICDFAEAKVYLQKLANISIDIALEWHQAFQYANMEMTIRPVPISPAKYEIENFLNLVDEIADEQAMSYDCMDAEELLNFRQNPGSWEFGDFE